MRGVGAAGDRGRACAGRPQRLVGRLLGLHGDARHLSESLLRGVLRIAGTTAGAAIALLLVPMLLPSLAAASLAGAAIGGLSLYGALTSRRAYAWLFVGLTFEMVLLDKLAHPGLAVVDFAETRLLEVIAGTVAVPPGVLQSCAPGRSAGLPGGQLQARNHQRAVPGVLELRGGRHEGGVDSLQAGSDGLGLAIMSQMGVAGSEDAVRCRPLRELLHHDPKPWNCLVETPIEEMRNADPGDAAAFDAVARVQSRRCLEARDRLVEVAGV